MRIRAERLPLLLFAVAVAARLPFLAQTTDDAFITYRYAENIASGLGFVYNAGERVLGVTTPLYALILAICARIGLPLSLAGPWLNVIADSLVAPVLARRPGADRAHLAPLLYALSPLNAFWAASGMETGLFCLATALALLFYEQRRWNPCAAAAAAALLIRIDAGILLVVLLAHFIVTQRVIPWRPIAIATGLVTPWILFATAYFGSPIPQPIFAKSALPKTGLLDALVNILAKGFLHPGTPFGALLIVGAGVALIGVRRKWLDPWTLYAAAFIGAYTLTRSQLHPWYYPPALVAYIPLAAAGYARLLEAPKARRMAPLIVVALAAASMLDLGMRWKRDLPAQVNLDTFLRRTGERVMMETRPGARIFLKDIGYLGYYSHLQVDDFAGLVSPRMVPYRARLDIAGAVREAQSDYLLLGSGLDEKLAAEPWFAEAYETRQIFRSGPLRMVLFEQRRREPTPQ